jgi:hypothetical protein
MPSVDNIPTAAIPIPYNPRLKLFAETRFAVSNPIAHKKAKIIAAAIVMTGMAVEIIPRPIPEIITVAGPDAELFAIF